MLSREEVEQIWKGLPKVANRVRAAGAVDTEEGMLINLQGFLEFDRQVSIYLVGLPSHASDSMEGGERYT